MIRKYILPLLAIVGVLLGIRAIIVGRQPEIVAKPVVAPPQPVFENYVAGSGIIESSSENISIASPLNGLVVEVNVVVGNGVNKGDILFRLDDRDLKADLEVKKAALEVAKSQLEDAKVQLAIREGVAVKGAVSVEDYNTRKYAALTAKAEVQRNEALVAAVEVALERMNVRAPITGDILQVKIHAGEYALAQSSATSPLMLLGETSPLHVRADIDENDAWRVDNKAKAVASLRGNSEIKSALEFVRFEPYVVPKKSLTGDSSERVDTRVLQVIYRITDSRMNARVGQLVDVFIESK